MNIRFNEIFRSKVAVWFSAIALVAVLASGTAVTAVAQETPAADPAAAPADPAAAPVDPAAAPVDPAAAPADPMAATADPTMATTPPATTETESPYSINHMLAEGGPVTMGTFIILVLMSAGSWYIMIMRLFDQTIVLRQANTAQKSFWAAGSLKDGAAKLEKDSAFRAIVEDGLRAAAHHEGKLTDQIDLNEWVSMSMTRSVEAVNSRLQAGVAFLASVGSTAPFVGLFGTVWGILNALIAIGVAGQVSIDRVAGPLGEALIMTAIGLFVAVPAVLGYNMVVRRNKIVGERLRNFSADVHAVLLSGVNKARA